MPVRYQLGRQFPGLSWHQWNGAFRDDVRRFVRGDPGMVPAADAAAVRQRRPVSRTTASTRTGHRRA